MGRKLAVALSLVWAIGSTACDDVVTTHDAGAEPARGPSLASYVAPAGMVKPVAIVRDYNGTFDGEVVSGGKDYSTLYRDRYAPTNGKGEGGGRHGGVDIRVDPGTVVRASLGGRVIRARCDWNQSRVSGSSKGWGGWVVIKARNPYGSVNDSVLFTYAHLDKFDFVKEGPNVYVTTGQTIGLSGGNLNSGLCPGNSTGPHLHFQIDKDFPNDLDRIWADVDNTNLPDTNYDVSDFTYNPMVFIQGGYRWEFETAGNAEYWSPGNARAFGVSGGAYWMDGDFDPWLRRGGANANVSCGRTYLCSSQITAEADFYRYIRLDLHLNCAVTPLTVYFTTDSYPDFHQDRRFEVPVGYGPVSVTIPAYANHGQWRGIITGLRVDPSVNCDWGNEINYIGYIRLVSSSTG